MMPMWSGSTPRFSNSKWRQPRRISPQHPTPPSVCEIPSGNSRRELGHFWKATPNTRTSQNSVHAKFGELAFYALTPVNKGPLACPHSASYYSCLQNSLSGGRRLLSWAAVTNVLALRKCLQRLFHRHQHRCLHRGQGAACRDSKHDASHRLVVRRLQDCVGVVFAEAIPKAV